VETYEESFEIDKSRRSWWRRWLKRIGWSLLILAVSSAGRQAWVHYQATKKLQETLTEMDRVEPGWRLEDIEAAREPVPEEENSARVVIAAARLLPKNWPPQEFHDPFSRLKPVEQFAPEDFARLTKELENVRPALKEAHKLTRMPRGRHHIVYERNVLDTCLNDQGETRRIATLLVCDVLRHDQNGDGKIALTSCRAAVNAARSLGDEPMTLSQLIRIACVEAACRAVERTLAQGEPSQDELMVIQRVLEVEETHPGLLICMRGERAMSDALFSAIENGDVSVNGLADVRWSWLDSALIWLWRMDTREDHALMLSLMAYRIAEAQLPMHEQVQAECLFEQDVRNLPRTAILTGLLMPAVTKLGKAFRRKHACLRCMIVALATEHYRQTHKTWPNTLDKLRPDFLSAVPVDPSDGKPLRYRRLDDGVVIYSVSSDGVDNNGNLDPQHRDQPGVDMGYRLWDVPKRRQPPKPSAPLPNPR
jgi:hypothetical protein